MHARRMEEGSSTCMTFKDKKILTLIEVTLETRLHPTRNFWCCTVVSVL